MSTVPHRQNAVDSTILEEYRQMGLGGAGDFVSQLIDQYLVEAAARVAQLTDAVARRDAPAMKLAAHSLKGSSGTVGANTLAGICEELETLARIPAFDGTSALATALGEEFARVREALELERAG